MIVLLHKNKKCIKAFYLDSKLEIDLNELDLVKGFFNLASRFENRFIIWCQLENEPYLNSEYFKKLCSHKLIMASYSSVNYNFISEKIGYVDSSPFANPKREVPYPTWIMSSCVGVIHSKVLMTFNADIFNGESFDYTLCSIAKHAQPKGLFCYAVPQLLRDNAPEFDPKKGSMFEMFKFVKRHYRTRWTAILFLNCFFYENKLLFLPFLKSLIISKKPMHLELSHLNASLETEIITTNYDVIIPTIGRKDYLYDVLRDLSEQTLRPINVIVIEQNPDIESISDLDYLNNEAWPFKIKHQFIHQTGACNARNLALKEVNSDFLFLADDDIRFKSSVLKDALKTMCNYNIEAATLSCLREGEQELHRTPLQWFTFGSGCSIVATKMAKKISFDTAYEFGFGEDSDFGMQLRGLGCDIVYIPQTQLRHLKAPIGGFRTVHKHSWAIDNVQPKPSPTVMLYNLKHQSIQQQKGYKTLLFLKFYRKQPIKNPLAYFNQMNLRWQKSSYWAEQLRHKTD